MFNVEKKEKITNNSSTQNYNLNCDSSPSSDYSTLSTPAKESCLPTSEGPLISILSASIK